MFLIFKLRQNNSDGVIIIKITGQRCAEVIHSTQLRRRSVGVHAGVDNNKVHVVRVDARVLVNRLNTIPTVVLA